MSAEPEQTSRPDEVTERLPVVRPATPRHAAEPTDTAAGAEPATGPIRLVHPTRSPHHPAPPTVPDRASPTRPSGTPVALWAAAGVAGLLAIGLFVDVVTVMSISDADAGQWFVVLYLLPMLLLAAAWGVLAHTVATARPTAPWLAAVLAACTVTSAVDDYDGPGPVVCLGALALAGCLGLSSTLRRALASPTAPPALLAARACAVWLTGACAVGALVALNLAGYGGDTGPLVTSGLLFLLLGGAAGWSVSAVGRLLVPGGARQTVGRVRVVLAVLAAVGVVAAMVAGAGTVPVLAVVPLVVSLVVAVLVPTDVRAFLGEAALAPVRRLDAVVAARSTSGTGRSPGGDGRRAGASGTVETAGRAAYAALPASVRSAPTTTKVIAGALGAVLVVVVAVLTTSDSNASAIGVLTVVVGLVAAAAVFTPTMPPLWRALCAGGALVSLYSGIDGSIGYSVRSDYVWLVGLLPLVLVGYVAVGFHANRANGVTASAPGWVGARPRVAPPGPSLTFVPPVTAKGRSQIRLEVRTTLEPATVLAVVRRSTDVRGNWFVVGGDTIAVAGEIDGGLGLVIGSGRGHAAFPARVHTDGTDTRLIIGGMDRWTQSRSYYAGFIPAGPAHVQGYWMYTLFLQTVASELRGCDPRAVGSIVT